MAAKSILKDAKAPLHFLRMAALSAARPKPVSFRAAIAAVNPPRPLTESEDLRRSLFDLRDGRIWALNSDLLTVQARGGRDHLVDEDYDDDEDFDDDEDYDDDEADDEDDFGSDGSDYDGTDDDEDAPYVKKRK